FVFARVIGDEIDDVPEEGTDALPGRIARASGRRRSGHPSTLARAPDVGTTERAGAVRREHRSPPPSELRRPSARARLDGEGDQGRGRAERGARDAVIAAPRAVLALDRREAETHLLAPLGEFPAAGDRLRLRSHHVRDVLLAAVRSVTAQEPV